MRRFLKATFLAVGLAAPLLLAVACGSNGSNGTPTDCTAAALPATVGPMTAGEMAEAVAVFNMVNTHRTGLGLGVLAWHMGAPGTSAGAAQVAYDHSADMQNRAFFAHTNPGCQAPSDRLDLNGITWSFNAENIARGQANAAAVMAAWLGSAGHRANIESATATMLGVGVRFGAGGPWWTQVFFTP
jgi:uncharacterized protein YkwD